MLPFRKIAQSTLFLLVTLLAVKAEILPLEKKADSMFQSLSLKEKALQLVWVSPTAGWSESTTFEALGIGGVYLSKPDVSYSDRLVVALQLDEHFNPGLEDEDLPGLQTLAALPDPSLLREYLGYIRTQARVNGYDYLVLPETGKQYMEVIENIHSFDPVFFLKKSSLAFEPNPKRDSFYPNLLTHRAIVIGENNLENYQKILNKDPKDIYGYEQKLLEQLTTQLRTPPREFAGISSKLVHQLWSQSIIPVQKQKGALPIKADTIALWTFRDQTILARELDTYFPTVLNVKYDRIPTGVPVIIDARENPLLAIEYAYAFAVDNPILWIGKPEDLTDVNAQSFLITPEVNEHQEYILPEMIYGSEPVSGQMKTSFPEFMLPYIFEPVSSQMLLGFGQPQWAGMRPAILDSLDLLAQEMIREYAAPGAQVLIAKGGKIIVDKSYGHLTYDSLIKVQPQTLYDLASVTKVTATLLAIMKLYEQGSISLDSTVGHYLDSFRGTNKEAITIRELLAHQAGLLSYIPFWKRPVNADHIEPFYYRSPQDSASNRKSFGYQPDPVMLDSLQSWIRASNLRNKKQYHYSDLGFMILHLVVESVSGKSLDAFVSETIYEPLGLVRTYFNPLARGFEIFEMAPTEYDYYFREEQVWGNVHDRNAAVFGGIAGHAGLFSNSREMAIILQMLLNGGRYGGVQVFQPETLDVFNQTYFASSRRGLGWDKPGERTPNVSSYASPRSFGHTGFTGTMIWADPVHDLIFVFLSNRVFPDSNNQTLIRLDIRRRMQDLVYRSFAD